MPEDILEAAQKVINDAAGITKEPGTTAIPPSQAVSTVESTVVPPIEPAPEPPSHTTTVAEVKMVTNNQQPPLVPSPEPLSMPPTTEPEAPVTLAQPAVDQKNTTVDAVINVHSASPSPQSEMPLADASQLVESILTVKNPDLVVPPAGAPPKHNSAPLPKRSSPGVIIAIIALLLLALPVGVYFVSQQNQQLADVRSRATGSTYGGTQCGNGTTCPAGTTCHCTGGQACTGYECVDPTWIENVCHSQGRSWCQNSEHSGDNGYTCCSAGYSCCSGVEGCCANGGPTNPPHTNHPTQPPGNDTPTPTTPVVHQCTNIKIYKGTVQVTPSTLVAGDNVTLAVKGNGTPNKGRLRVNGAVWTESTTANSNGEYTLAYTIPAGVTDFVIEGEIFVDGVWK